MEVTALRADYSISDRVDMRRIMKVSGVKDLDSLWSCPLWGLVIILVRATSTLHDLGIKIWPVHRLHT